MNFLILSFLPLLIIFLVLVFKVAVIVSKKGTVYLDFYLPFTIVLMGVYAVGPFHFLLFPEPYQQFSALRGIEYSYWDGSANWYKYLYVVYFSVFFSIIAGKVKLYNGIYSIMKDGNHRGFLVGGYVLALFFATVLMLTFYVVLKGGPIDFVIQSLAARHLNSESSNLSSADFLWRLIRPFIAFSFLYFVVCYKFKTRYFGRTSLFRIKLLVFFSGFILLYVAVAHGGRAFLLFSLLQFVFVLFFLDKVKKYLIIAPIPFLIIFMIYGKPLFHALATIPLSGVDGAISIFQREINNPNVTASGVAGVLRYFINYPQNLIIFSELSIDNFRFLLVDIFNFFYVLWPRSVFDPGIRPETIQELSSSLVGGDSAGGNVPGLLASLSLIGGWWLVPFFIFIYVFLSRIFLLKVLKGRTPVHYSAYVLLYFTLVLFVWNGEPTKLANSTIPVLLILVGYFSYRQVRNSLVNRKKRIESRA